MKITTALVIIGCTYASVVGATERCDVIASSLVRAAMITPGSAYDFRSVDKQLIAMCKTGSDAAAKGENINDAIIANLKYRNEMASKVPDANRAALELADLAFQLGFDTYDKK